jgi:hypothetical protein
MKYFYSILCGFIFVIAFTACQKEIDGNLTEQSESDSIFLEKIYLLDSISPTQVDTFSKNIFSYDNQKRVRQSLSYSVGQIDTLRTDYFYVGNDSLPFKTVEHILSDIGLGLSYYRDTTFFQYNTSGKVVKDSSVEWYVTGNQNFGVLVNDFISIGNEVIINTRGYDFINGQYVLSSSYRRAKFITLSNGNIVNQIDTVSGSSIELIQMSFDARPSPVYKAIKIHYPCLFSDEDAQKNNPVDAMVTSASFTNRFTYNYLYRNDNYPSTEWVIDQTGYKIKTLYFYRTL